MLRPDDIRTTTFKKGFFGYKPAEVDSFKETVFRAYNDLSKDYEETKEKFDKLTKAMEDTRLKLFDLENKLQQTENSSAEEEEAAKRKADQIIRDAQAQADKILANAKAQSGQPVKEAPKAAAPKPEPPKPEAPKESASSKFFKKADEEVHNQASSDSDDDDEIFVGEIEDARKPDRMMIGDGEEEDEGFEFL